MLSTTTCRREGVKAVLKDVDMIKEKFKDNLVARNLTLHFDGKAVKEYTRGCHLDQERIAVIVSSPTLQSPQVLGVPPANRSNQPQLILRQFRRNISISDPFLITENNKRLHIK